MIEGMPFSYLMPAYGKLGNHAVGYSSDREPLLQARIPFTSSSIISPVRT